MERVHASSFGSGLGNAYELGMALHDERVTPAMVHQAVADPIRKAAVGAAFRGEMAIGDVSLDQILEREINVVTTLCGEDWMQYGAEGAVKALEQQIEAALRKVEETWGSVTIHDRIIPAGLKLDRIFTGVYAYNAHNPDAPIKLGHDPNKEWWRTDRQVGHIPTEFGVIRQDLTKVLQPTDVAGRPFYLNLDDQIVWSKTQGGDGLTTTEETTYLWLRSLYERNLPLWGAGSCRTTNACSSLLVLFSAADGLIVGRCGRGPGWVLGAVARKYLAVG